MYFKMFGRRLPSVPSLILYAVQEQLRRVVQEKMETVEALYQAKVWLAYFGCQWEHMSIYVHVHVHVHVFISIDVNFVFGSFSFSLTRSSHVFMLFPLPILTFIFSLFPSIFSATPSYSICQL